MSFAQDAKSHGLVLEEEDYTNLIKVCVSKKQSGKLFDVLLEMKDYVRCISPQTGEVLKNWFIKQNRIISTEVHISKNGKCDFCQETLRPIELTETDRRLLLQQIVDLAMQSPKRIKSKLYKPKRDNKPLSLECTEKIPPASYTLWFTYPKSY